MTSRDSFDAVVDVAEVVDAVAVVAGKSSRILRLRRTMGRNRGRRL